MLVNDLICGTVSNGKILWTWNNRPERDALLLLLEKNGKIVENMGDHVFLDVK